MHKNQLYIEVYLERDRLKQVKKTDSNKTNESAGVEYIQLHEDSILTWDNLIRIADLVYDTDPYIYPAMFGCREAAERMIPLLMDNRDIMFRRENCFVAVERGQVVGLLLWSRGSLNWSPQLLKELSEKQRTKVSPYLDMAANEYVDGYRKDQEDRTICIINVCIEKGHQGKGIGRKMMETFFEQMKEDVYELCVLQDNPGAVHLYRSLGFVEYEYYNGFSVDHRKLPAVRMRKI